MSIDIFRATRFASGHWGHGGFDGVGFYTGGQRGEGQATLNGTAAAFGDPIRVALDGKLLALAAYGGVPGGIILTTRDFVYFYVFVRGGFDPQRHYDICYAFGDFSPPIMLHPSGRPGLLRKAAGTRH